jgi:hypothetical protein
LLALVVSPQSADTTLAVSRGDRLVIDGLGGSVTIVAWDRDVLEVRSETTGAVPVEVRRVGATVQLGAEGVRRRRTVAAAVRVPAWIDMDIRGTALDVDVRGADGAIQVSNVDGDVTIQDAGGPVDVRSVRGAIAVTDARAGARASSQVDDVTLRRIVGPVEAHSGDGNIILEAIASRAVRAETLDGDVTFSGTIEAGGEYGFYLHDGDAVIEVQRAVGAQVSVSTFDGEFTSDFPVRVERFSAGREFDFVLGDGSARIEIEVFDGEIRLLQRP